MSTGKLVLLLNHGRYVSSFALVTRGRRVESAWRACSASINNPSGGRAGPTGHVRFAESTRQQIYSITRLKEEAVYAVHADCKAPQKATC